MDKKIYSEALEAHMRTMQVMNDLHAQAEQELTEKLKSNISHFQIQTEDGGRFRLEQTQAIISVFGKFIFLYFINTDLDRLKLSSEQKKAVKAYHEGKINPEQLISLIDTCKNEDSDGGDESEPDTHMTKNEVGITLQIRMGNDDFLEFLSAKELSLKATDKEIGIVVKE